MNKTFFAAAVIASGLVFGTTGLALAQQGVGNVPADGQAINQLNAEGAVNSTDRATTTGYSDRSERDVPSGWQAQGRKPVEPLLPRH